jgi:hypothetical protein
MAIQYLGRVVLLVTTGRKVCGSDDGGEECGKNNERESSHVDRTQRGVLALRPFIQEREKGGAS